jgi:hypothetical protein
MPIRVDLPVRKVNTHLLPSPFTKSLESVEKQNLLVRGPSPCSLYRPSRRRRNGSSPPRFSLHFRVVLIGAIITMLRRERSLCRCRHLVIVFSVINAMFWGYLGLQHCTLSKSSVTNENRLVLMSLGYLLRVSSSSDFSPPSPQPLLCG